MRPPSGTVEGLCTASATIFAVGIAFLGVAFGVVAIWCAVLFSLLGSHQR